MKPLLFALLLCIGTSALFAQGQKTVIYSNITYQGKVDYGDLKKLLPDSLAAKLLIDPKKAYNLRQPDHVLLWMTTNGRKLVGTNSNVMSGSSFIGYLMSKDIYLDSAAYALYVNDLMNIEVKKKK